MSSAIYFALRFEILPSQARLGTLALRSLTKSQTNELSMGEQSSLSSALPTAEELANLYVLDSLKGFGPQKFKQLYEGGVAASEVIRNPELIPISGKRGDPIREQLQKLTPTLVTACYERAEKQLKVAASTGSLILTYSNPFYPKLVFASNSPIPVLYVRGDVEVLQTDRTVACVGSRKIRDPYSHRHAAFARTACREGFAVISGFALGADTLGHMAAIECGGKTICVMPSGLDRPFPPENRELWRRLLSTDGVAFVSEFPFGTGAVSLNLRKRNKSIVAFALGVMVSQTSKTGGAMNAYRFALEQKKPIATFEDDGTEDTSGNREIALAGKARPAVFQPGNDSVQEYVSWLHGLSSST